MRSVGSSVWSGEGILILVLLYVGLLVTLGPTAGFSEWASTPSNNPCAAEALAWTEGRLDVPSPGIDVATVDGRHFNIFPPLWTILCFVVFKLQIVAFGGPVSLGTVLFNLLVSIPIPVLYYIAFRNGGAGRRWGAVLAFHAIAGTCLWTVAPGCRWDFIYSIQIVVSQIGLALVLVDLLGRQRLWLAGLGVLIAAWSRQTCIAYALPLLWIAWRESNRRSALLRAGLPILVAVAVPLTLNCLKFGSPLETGYRYIDEVSGPDGVGDVFALRFAPAHAYSMWLSPPSFDWTHQGLSVSGSGAGTAVWMGTPLLLLTLFDVRRWWADRTRRALMLGTLPVILALLMYHGPSLGQAGYYRYTPDFVLIWLVVVAPWTTGDRRTWFTLGCLAWSTFYFYMITRSVL